MPVRLSKDFHRVRALPTRSWLDNVKDLTGQFRRPGGTMTLRPIQSAALAEIREHGGGFIPARTGSGKLLLSLLIPQIMNAQRAVIVVPASRRAPTHAAWLEYNKHFHLRQCSVITYSDLSSTKSPTMLADLNPDLMVYDEAHSAKDSEGARWRRTRRITKDIPFIAMSGSFANRGLGEWAHLAVRALGEGAPVPLDWAEQTQWHRGLSTGRDAIDPGCLIDLMPGSSSAQEAFGRRLIATPGVVSSGSDVPDIPLTFGRLHVPPTADQVALAKYMQDTWLTPCDWPIDTALDMWRHKREAGLGFYLRWRDPPPGDWLLARKEFSCFVREHTSGNWRWDLPTQVIAAVGKGELQDYGDVIGRWRAVEPAYTPIMKPVWVTEHVLQAAAKWARDNRGIVWVTHQEFGDQLASMTGMPYCKEGACDAQGRHIEEIRGPVIASVFSCGTGHNLQHHQRNLVTCVPSPILLEQLISRTHRDGQKSPCHVDFLTSLPSDDVDIDKAVEDARSVSSQFSVIQRLIYGEWV